MIGKLLVISGLSGSGKDAVIDKFLEKQTSFKRLVTVADRPPRPGEINGVHYYFLTAQELDLMHKRNELVEKPLHYGESRKATPKKEFHKIIYGGTSLVWRIESSLAAHVASGKFFEEEFTSKEGKLLKDSTTIIFITANKDEVTKRRKARDGAKYNPKDYEKRDAQDKIIIKKYEHLFLNILENKDGQLEKTVEKIITTLARK
jgi:guanylate kinase